MNIQLITLNYIKEQLETRLIEAQEAQAQAQASPPRIPSPPRMPSPPPPMPTGRVTRSMTRKLNNHSTPSASAEPVPVPVTKKRTKTSKTQKGGRRRRTHKRRKHYTRKR